MVSFDKLDANGRHGVRPKHDSDKEFEQFFFKNGQPYGSFFKLNQ